MTSVESQGIQQILERLREAAGPGKLPSEADVRGVVTSVAGSLPADEFGEVMAAVRAELGGSVSAAAEHELQHLLGAASASFELGNATVEFAPAAAQLEATERARELIGRPIDSLIPPGAREIGGGRTAHLGWDSIDRTYQLPDGTQLTRLTELSQTEAKTYVDVLRLANGDIVEAHGNREAIDVVEIAGIRLVDTARDGTISERRYRVAVGQVVDTLDRLGGLVSQSVQRTLPL